MPRGRAMPVERIVPPELAEQIGDIVSHLKLRENVSVRNHLMRLGFRPARNAWGDVAFWYLTRRQIARIDRVNHATLFARINHSLTSFEV